MFAIREALAFPFFLLAMTFIFLDTLIMYGLDVAMETIAHINSDEES